MVGTVQLFSALCIGLKPSARGKDFKEITYFFNTSGGIFFKQGFCFVVFFRCGYSGFTCPLGAGIFTL